MSLVGTRPPTVDEWDKYELHHRARLATKPGLTGMWQVSGRSNITDFFQKNRRQNNIQIDSVKNGNIYQDSIIKVENPAIAISHIKDNPEDLKITLDSISNIFLRQSKINCLICNVISVMRSMHFWKI